MLPEEMSRKSFWRDEMGEGGPLRQTDPAEPAAPGSGCWGRRAPGLSLCPFPGQAVHLDPFLPLLVLSAWLQQCLQPQCRGARNQVKQNRLGKSRSQQVDREKGPLAARGQPQDFTKRLLAFARWLCEVEQSRDKALAPSSRATNTRPTCVV